MKKIFLLSFLLFTSFIFAQDTISSDQASQYIGKEVWVTGTIASIKTASEGKNTNYLNIDKPYPDAPFTVVVSNKYVVEKQMDLAFAKGKKIRVKGTVSIYEKDPKKTPQIFNPTEIIIE